MTVAVAAAAAAEEEVDPFDAFMAEIDTVVVQQAAAATTKASEIERVGDVDADKVIPRGGVLLPLHSTR